MNSYDSSAVERFALIILQFGFSECKQSCSHSPVMAFKLVYSLILCL